MTHQSQDMSRLAVSVLSILGIGALALALGWIAIEFAVELANAFEAIAEIVGWVLWPLLI